MKQICREVILIIFSYVLVIFGAKKLQGWELILFYISFVWVYNEALNGAVRDRQKK